MSTGTDRHAARLRRVSIACLLLLAALAGLVGAVSAESRAPTVPVGTQFELPLGPELEIYRDEGGTATVLDLMQGADRFRPARPSEYFGLHKGQLWIRLRLANVTRSTLERWLVVGRCLQERVDLYRVRSDGSIQTFQNGTRVPVEARAVPTREVLFPVELREGESETIFLAFSGRAMTAFSLGLWDRGHYLKSVQTEAALKYLATGTNALLIVACVLAAHARRRWGLAMGGLGYALLCAYSMFRDGYGVGLLPAGEPLIQQRLMQVLLAAAAVCQILFTNAFLHLEDRSRRLAIANSVFALVMTALTFLLAFVFLPWLSLGSTLIVWALLTAISAWAARDIRGWAYLAWWGLLWAGMLVTLGKGLGWLPMGILPGMVPTLLGLLLACLILSYGLYRDVIEIQRAAVDVQNHLISQQRSEGVRLRRAVRNRTRELRSALLVAKKAGHERSEFLSMMAHELRAPLHIILGHGELMRREIVGKPVSRLDVIERNARRLYQLIEHALSYSRGTSDAVELEPAPVDLDVMLGHLVEEAQFGTGHDGPGFSLEIRGQLPRRVMVDQQRLLQVLLNLLANAVKYGGSGKVTLRVEVLERSALSAETGAEAVALHHLRFSVLDQGAGIPLEDQQRIFDPFTRLATTRHQPGQGLGLTIARQLVRAMGGDIQVQSSPGVGSCFSFELVLEGRAVEDVAEPGNGRPMRLMPPAEVLTPLGAMVALGEVIEMRRWIIGSRSLHPEWDEYFDLLDRCCSNVDLAGLKRLLTLAGVNIDPPGKPDA